MSEKKLLILDLDETLIHATPIPLDRASEYHFDEYSIYVRPGLEEFLNGCKEKYDVAIWSSADDDYVHSIVELVKPKEFDFVFVWERSRCTTRRHFSLDKYVFEKRLKKAKKLGYSIEHMLIVDDSPEKTRENYGNAIYVKEFNGDLSDNELEILLEYLNKIANKDNLRRIEKRGWRNTR